MSKDKMLAEWFWTDRWQGSSGFEMPIGPRGLYREMLTQAWRKGGSLPNDHETIRRICGVTEAEWDACWPRVCGFWRVDGDRIVNDTQSEVYAEALAMRQRAQARAQAGAQAKHKQKLKQCPPSPSPSPSNGLPVPVRDADDDNSECTELSNTLHSTLVNAQKITGIPAFEILADAKVRGKSNPIMNPLACTMASRKLWRVTIDRVNGFVAAWQSDRRGKATRKGGAPSWDRPDALQENLDARAALWISTQDFMPIRSRSEIELIADEAPEDIRGAVTMLLVARNPHLRGQVSKGEAA